MSEKITDYIEVTSLPTDTLFDVSIDTSTVPKTRSISKANLATEMGVFYNSDGVINDLIRKVDINSNALHFEKGRIGFGASVATAGSESYLFKPLTVGEAVIRVLGGVTGTDEYFLIDDGGFIGINGASQDGVEVLGVNGETYLDGYVYMSSSLDVDGLAGFYGQAEFYDDVDFFTNVDIDGSLQVDTDITGLGDLQISGLTKLLGSLSAGNLPTSSAGLVAGDVWNNSGVLNIV